MHKFSSHGFLTLAYWAIIGFLIGWFIILGFKLWALDREESQDLTEPDPRPADTDEIEDDDCCDCCDCDCGENHEYEDCGKDED